MTIFLIHGMGRTPLSMWVLAQRLARAGHTTHRFGYLVTRETLPAIAERFVDFVRATLDADPASADEDPGYAVVGHSLGNIVTRLASPQLPPGFRGFVMLAPPNQSPAVARTLRRNPVFRLLTRDAGQRLCDASFYEALPVPDVPALIVAGTRGPRWRHLPFGGRANDAIVSVDETRLGDTPLITVHGAHTFLMNRRDVFDLIRTFLASREGEDVSASITG